MFKSLHWSHIEHVDSSSVRYCYSLHDSAFSEVVSVLVPIQFEADRNFPMNYAQRIVVVIETYQKKNLPVASNIARLWFYNQTRIIPEPQHTLKDCEWIDKYFPQLEYGKKYYPCILRQYGKLIGKRV